MFVWPQSFSQYTSRITIIQNAVVRIYRWPGLIMGSEPVGSNQGHDTGQVS